MICRTHVSASAAVCNYFVQCEFSDGADRFETAVTTSVSINSQAGWFGKVRNTGIRATADPTTSNGRKW
jgi:hypothetical protein